MDDSVTPPCKAMRFCEEMIRTLFKKTNNLLLSRSAILTSLNSTSPSVNSTSVVSMGATNSTKRSSSVSAAPAAAAAQVPTPTVVPAADSTTASSPAAPTPVPTAAAPAPSSVAPSSENIFFFDIDNCLYHKSTGIYLLMGERIRSYILSMGHSQIEAEELHKRYYVEYGLAIRGLVKHHQIDPVEYDRVVDGGLPLEKVLQRDDSLRAMLEGMRGVRKWCCTNAGLAHAKRVLNILGISDLFEGITYCDYSEPDFKCKPERAFYDRAMKEAGVSADAKVWFVDDSAANVDAAVELGWTVVHVADTLPSKHGHHQVTDIHDLPKVLPEFWPDWKPKPAVEEGEQGQTDSGIVSDAGSADKA
ncbi:hypothetical protein HK101_003818 [Irineochytrium annulatum]|nr:hypothetical protein HK101_003818 [Irineochytrium annulatum]